MSELSREAAVFVNCPFDPTFQPLFDGLVFAITACGFTVRSALDITDSGHLRLAKIIRLIECCRFSIHDISRVELDGASGLPRFNMPIELDIAIGMKHLGRSKLRDHLLLVLDTERYRYQQFASDLAGVDIAAHKNELPKLIGEIRRFLAPHSLTPLPGAAALLASYERFEAALPALAKAARQDVRELTYLDRLHHLSTFLALE